MPGRKGGFAMVTIRPPRPRFSYRLIPWHNRVAMDASQLEVRKLVLGRRLGKVLEGGEEQGALVHMNWFG